jgi:hypothetical protein
MIDAREESMSNSTAVVATGRPFEIDPTAQRQEITAKFFDGRRAGVARRQLRHE